MYIEDAADLFIQDRKTFCSLETVNFYIEKLTLFEKYLDTQHVYEIEQLTSDILKGYLIYLRSTDVKNTTIRCYFRAINAFCFFLIDQELINYFKYKIKLPRPDPEPVLPLTFVEVDHLMSIISTYTDPEYRKRDMLIFRLMLDMGLRSKEVRQLRRKDLHDDIIIIVNSKYDKSRMLPIPPDIKRLLDEYDINRFRSNDVIIDITKNGIKLMFQRLKRRSGITRIHAHLLRHTFATSYMLHRNNIEYLRMYLGHEDYSTTRHYIHLASQCLLTHYDIYKISDIFL